MRTNTGGRRFRRCGTVLPGLVLSLVAIIALVPALGRMAGASTSTSTSVPVQDDAYWLVAADGAVYNFGGAPNDGSVYGHALNAAIVGMAATPTGKGFWLVASDGGIFTFGAAQFYGSMGGQHLNAPIVGIAATPTGKGYWEVASDGGIFTFGAAQFYGSMGGSHLNKPVVGIAATSTGAGYWEVASDGGMFTFGKAQFDGSMGGTVLNRPIVAMATAPTGDGYWEVASDGGMFTFGKAAFAGSLGSSPPSSSVVGMSATFTGTGYWLAAAGGTVSNFGQAQDWGSAVGVSSPIVGMATAVGTGEKTTPPVYSGAPDPGYASGSYGYDVSSYTCAHLPPSPHAIGVVQVAGGSFDPLNPCFAKEATWAGSGLSLYLYLTFGSSATPEPGCAGNPTAPTTAACDYGYAAGLDAYDLARGAIGTRADVTWWLDIEEGGWSASTAANRSTVVGAYDALRGAGPTSVGFYFSVSNWNDIVGAYNPVAAPLFPAWWTGPSPQYKCANARAVAASNHNVIPSGPVTLVQYGSSSTWDYDYAC